MWAQFTLHIVYNDIHKLRIAQDTHTSLPFQLEYPLLLIEKKNESPLDHLLYIYIYTITFIDISDTFKKKNICNTGTCIWSYCTYAKQSPIV